MSRQSSPQAPEAPLRLSRWRAAWRVLLGESVVDEQIRQDWLSYRLLFDDLLKRWSAMLARQAKADHARIRDQLAAEEPTNRTPAASPKTRKEEVRRRAAEARGLAGFRAAVAAHPTPFNPCGGPPPPLNRLSPELLELDDDDAQEEDEAP